VQKSQCDLAIAVDYLDRKLGRATASTATGATTGTHTATAIPARIGAIALA